MFQIFNSVSSQTNGFFTHVKVVHGGPSRCLPSFGLPGLRVSNVKGPLHGTFSYKKTKKSTSALLKGVDCAQTVTRKSKCTRPQSPTDLFPDSYLELYPLLLKKRKKSTRALLKGVDCAETVTRKSKCTRPQSPTDLFPDSYLELYPLL
jgi:hypothetical protein